ncbi:hypothetical protein FRX31_008410 [Thalictrum thalictroides]|uniref:Uncharacterized protein n=1 Tax=Thalictrum thalictroides TaxID=46969 RepID=A0A7J6WX48_THATH|nr:hypothetical protein FRX31_008410 [Thalictrum thalictroides]
MKEYEGLKSVPEKWPIKEDNIVLQAAKFLDDIFATAQQSEGMATGAIDYQPIEEIVTMKTNPQVQVPVAATFRIEPRAISV